MVKETTPKENTRKGTTESDDTSGSKSSIKTFITDFQLPILRKRRTLPQRIYPHQRPSGYDVSSNCPVSVSDLVYEDAIIVVMGPTGAGKSTFIQTVTGDEKGVGHSLESFTNKISAVRVEYSDGVRVVLVDTPGFDDTHLSDMKVLKITADWLRDVRKHGFKLSGILYLHRITDNRMAGTPLKNLSMFRKLSGKQFFPKVTLMTTMWPEPDDSSESQGIYEEREEELKNEYWAEMLGRGSRTKRFENSQASAWSIIDSIISMESDRQWSRIQQELVDQGKRLPSTEAGQQLHGILEEYVEKQNDILHRLRDEMEKAADAEAINALRDELNILLKKRRDATREMQQLDQSTLGNWRRFLMLFNK